jgi:aspartate kinase
MAAALGAEYCEICSDVDGVYTADPRLVATARRIGTLSYEETQELAESGAKVLNAQAVEFAKEKGIAIYARATASPLPGDDPASDGSVVRKHAPRAPGSVAGVASERDVLVLQASGDAGALIDFLDARGVSGKQLHVTAFGGRDAAATVIVSRENLHDEERVRRELPEHVAGSVAVIDGLGAVSVVGAGINATYANVRRGNACLREAGVPSRGLATSSFRITWLVPATSLDAAVRTLHREFLENAEFGMRNEE